MIDRLLLVVILFFALSHSAPAQTNTDRIAALERRATAAERRIAELEEREQAYRRFILWQTCQWNRGMDTAGPLGPALGPALGFTRFTFAAGTACPPASTRMNVPQ